MLAWAFWTDRLGADPISTLLNQLGFVALALLVFSLLCTPARIVSSRPWPMKLRRQLGLMAAGYAAAHLFVWMAFDRRFAFRAILEDLLKRPFILFGMAAFLCLVPLALTSTNASIKRLGGVKWRKLHRLAYVAGALAVVHFYMRVKKDISQPVFWGVILGAGLVLRAAIAMRKKDAKKGMPKIGA